MLKLFIVEERVVDMKRVIDILLLTVLVVFVNVSAMELPNLYSNKVLLYDPSEEEILYEKGIDDVSNIASLTKIMTTITAIDLIEDLDKMVTIDRNVLNEIPYDASIAGLREGDRVTLRDLLYASILPSGADATTALAHNTVGSTKKFVEAMNEKASSLGLNNTHFANVTGYDIPNHHSTPREILKILEYALENPLFDEIYKTRKYTLSNGLVVKSTLDTYNRYMGLDLTGILGSKTGYTGDAGMCMSALFETGGKELILITLGAPYSYVTPFNLKDTITIKEYLDKNYSDEVIFEEGKTLVQIPVVGSKEELYEIKVSSTVRAYVEKERLEADAYFEFDGVATLSYKNEVGSRLGKIKYYYKDELLMEEEVFLTSALHFSLYKFVKAHVFELSVVFGIIIACIFIRRKKKKRRRKKRRVISR